MKITWIGHSCFKIEKENYVIITDPYEDGYVPGLAAIHEKANQVLCSHEHGDHNARGVVEIIENANNPFQIETIETYHDEVQGAKRGKNKIFIIDDGENRIAHMGDLGCEPDEEQMKKLENLDILLIPVGGTYTIDGKQAAELAMRLKPRMIIPMHYRDEKLRFGFPNISTAADFIETMGSVMPTNTCEIESTNELQAQVVVLQPQNASSVISK